MNCQVKIITVNNHRDTIKYANEPDYHLKNVNIKHIIFKIPISYGILFLEDAVEKLTALHWNDSNEEEIEFKFENNYIFIKFKYVSKMTQEKIVDLMKDNFKINNGSVKISEICVEYAVVPAACEDEFTATHDLHYHFKLRLLREFDEEYDGKIIKYIDDDKCEYESKNNILVNCILKTPESLPYWISTQLTLGEEAIRTNGISINSLPLNPKDFDIYDYVPYAPPGLSMQHR